MATLYPVVDHFVIAEATRSFKGDVKPLLYLDNIKRFEPWNDKVRHVLVDDMPEGEGVEPGKAREAFQRSAIQRGFPAGVKDDDVVIMSDCDEIPRPEMVKSYRVEQGLVGLEWRMFLFYLNVEWYETQPNWIKLFPAGLLRSSTLWDVRITDCHQHTILPGGGWHFTFMGGARTIAAKAVDFSCYPGSLEVWSDVAACQDALDNIENDASQNPIAKFKKLTVRGRDDDWPEYVRDNWDTLVKRGLIYVPKNERA